MSIVTIKIKGLKELDNALKQLPIAVQGKALQSSVKEAANLIKDRAENNLDSHDKTGTLKKNVTAKLNKKRTSEWRAAYWVGVKSLTNAEVIEHRIKSRGTVKSKAAIAKITPGDKGYWRFLEFGSSRQVKQPFLTPAFESQKMEAIESIKRKLAMAIEKAAAKWKVKP